ncbi:hypothetical protein ABPG72_021128 [Tetrahymena utriculariae]
MRKYFIKAIGILALIQITLASSCTKLNEGSLYDFTPLQNSQPNLYKDSTGNLYWSVCNDNYLSYETCNSNTYAAFYDNLGQCSYLTGSNEFNTSEFDFIDDDNHSQGIIVKFQSGQQVNGVQQQFVLYVVCDSSINTYNSQSLEVKNGVYTLSISSKAGCPTVDYSSIWNFMNDNKWVGTIFLIVVGFFLCFFGLKLIKLTLFLTGFTLGFLLSFFIFEACLKPDSSSGLNWTAIIVSVLVGIVGAIIAFKVERAGIFCLGALAGTFLAFIIFNTFHFASSNKFVLWIEVGLCSFIFGCLCIYIKSYILILASSLVGAYMIVRGISLYPGGFPNELTVSQQLKNGDWSFPWYYYLYLAAIIILKVCGGIFQYRRYKNKGSSRESNTSDDYRQMKK